VAYLVALVLAIGFGVPVAVLSGAIGQGKAVSAALEGIARQPEAAGRIQTAMIIGLALIESLVIYALLISLILLFLGVPSASELIKTVVK
jgi:F-type H+-transporting ATPase subunit c